MTPELKTKWCAALRSGEYKQCRGRLKRANQHSASFCCLGVLRHVIDPKDREADHGDLTNRQLREFGLPHELAFMLMMMNDWNGEFYDDPRTFPQIADCREEKL